MAAKFRIIRRLFSYGIVTRIVSRMVPEGTHGVVLLCSYKVKVTCMMICTVSALV